MMRTTFIKITTIILVSRFLEIVAAILRLGKIMELAHFENVFSSAVNKLVTGKFHLNIYYGDNHLKVTGSILTAGE